MFFMSHGWEGDVQSAIDQYDRWFGRDGESPRRSGSGAAAVPTTSVCFASAFTGPVSRGGSGTGGTDSDFDACGHRPANKCSVMV